VYLPFFNYEDTGNKLSINFCGIGISPKETDI